MRKILPLLLLLLTPMAAAAQDVRVDGATVVEYGIFTADTTQKVADPASAMGTRNVITNIHHATTTTTIPAELGVRFGFRTLVSGAPEGAQIPVQMVLTFPPAGLRNPDTGKIVTKEQWDAAVLIGTPSYKGYNFEHPEELVPGKWTWQIWYQGRLLAEQSFTVVKP